MFSSKLEFGMLVLGDFLWLRMFRIFTIECSVNVRFKYKKICPNV